MTREWYTQSDGTFDTEQADLLDLDDRLLHSERFRAANLAVDIALLSRCRAADLLLCTLGAKQFTGDADVPETLD